MKTKTRKLIGQTLIWSALVVQTFVYLKIQIDTDFSFNMSTNLLGISIIALLIGGLWGMRK